MNEKEYDHLINMIREYPLYDNFERSDFKNKLQSIFEIACDKGDRDIVEWIYDSAANVYDVFIDLHVDNEKIFRKLCANSNRILLEWLISVSKSDSYFININACDDEGFRWMCVNGRTDDAEWLYNISKDNKKININALEDNAFQNCCKENRLHTAKWLYNLSKIDGNTKIDIHSGNGYSFIVSCTCCHEELAIWLYGISNTDDNVMITITPNFGNRYALVAYDKKQYKLVELLCSITDIGFFTGYADGEMKLIKSTDIKQILIINDANMIKKVAEKSTDQQEACIICFEYNKFWVKFQCPHQVCKDCYLKINICPYRCICDISSMFVKLIEIDASTS